MIQMKCNQNIRTRHQKINAMRNLLFLCILIPSKDIFVITEAEKRRVFAEAQQQRPKLPITIVNICHTTTPDF